MEVLFFHILYSLCLKNNLILIMNKLVNQTGADPLPRIRPGSRFSPLAYGEGSGVRSIFLPSQLVGTSALRRGARPCVLFSLGWIRKIFVPKIGTFVLQMYLAPTDFRCMMWGIVAVHFAPLIEWTRVLPEQVLRWSQFFIRCILINAWTPIVEILKLPAKLFENYT